MSEDNLRSLLNKRSAIKGQLTRFKTFLESYHETNNVSELTKRVQKIETIWNSFQECQIEIDLLEGSNVQSKEWDSFEKTYFELVSRAQDIIDSTKIRDNVDIPVSSSTATNQNLQRSVQNIELPDLHLPQFKGDYSEYMQFHDAFKGMIHDNNSLTKTQKFYYLRSCLQDEALNVIHSLKINDANYDVAWHMLRETFENKSSIINAHLKSLVELPTLTKESPSALRQFLNSITKDIRCLKNLGIPVETWDLILIYLFSSKLDNHSKREWQSKQKEDVLPTIDDFSNFLRKRYRFLESLSTNSNDMKQSRNLGNKGSDGNKSFAHVSTNKLRCFYCKEGHFLYYCKRFTELSVEDRINETKKLNLCLNCLRNNHNKKDCKSSGCKTCGKRHNTLLHLENAALNKGTETQNISAQETESNKPVIATHCSQLGNAMILLSTAVVCIYDQNNKAHECRCLLDSGSQSNFITKCLADKLKLKLNTINLPVLGINQSATNIQHNTSAKIKSKYNNYSKHLTFLVLNNITGQIPIQSFALSQINIPENINLADPKFNESGSIDMLLGASIFYDLLCIGQIKLGNNKPIMQKSKLGWFISGPLQFEHNKQTCLLSINDSPNLQAQLERFWKLEDTPQLTKQTKEEQFCEQHFLENYSRDDNTGRFTVALPLKDNYTQLGDTFEIAKKRFLNLEQKLHKDKNLFESYSNFMREYEMLNHMTKLDDSQIVTNDIISYLPHHGVFKASSVTTKLRVVFDASVKSSTDISLNDVSYIGPIIQDDLFSILLRFRKHNYVIKADITKMYRQIMIKPEQRNLQRILWRENPDQDLSHYMLNTVTYGTAPASFLAIRSLHQTALDNKRKFPKASNIILSDFYVDDLITGDDTIEGLGALKLEIFDILKSAGFILTQWMSNSIEVLESNEQTEMCHISDDKTIKTLGILWDPRSDNFQYTVQTKIYSQGITKRIILSIIAQIFDPLGLIGPVIIKAKLILQQLWKLQLEWDEILPYEHQTRFLQFFNDLENLNKVSIPRHVLLPNYVHIQLHGFADASEASYGCCIYLRTTNLNREHHTRLLCAKSRVAPLKVISLPRLELCGAVLLSRLVDKVIKAIKIDINDVFFWTDSKIVLSWLSQEPATWKTFVSNRVSEIQELTSIGCWGHVRSADNPADIISRGCNTNLLMKSNLWWTGPEWLKRNIEEWPSEDKSNIMPIPDQRHVINLSHACIYDLDIFTKFSTLKRLVNVMAYCLRFINNTKVPKCQRFTDYLTIPETTEATNTLIKLVQRQIFSQELHDLENTKCVSKNSKLLCLNPFLDDKGIIRVGGRLRQSDLKFDHKHPVILPSTHNFTNLIILHEHERTLHGGTQTVLSSIRMNYWPLNGKDAVRKVIRKCITCFKARPTHINPIMGNLPTLRIKISRPFITSGVDFAGPIMVKDGTLRNRKLVKAYICLFICFSTKAVHIELVGDLSTQSFLNALKRFIARRGICKDIYSDNGLNFIGANNELTNFYDTILKISDSVDFKNYLLENRITWHFIPPRAPHMGGLWESAIKLTKQHLTRVIGNAHLTYENFYTVLTQVESILNSRPLCPLSSDPNDYDPLTPGHFLIGSKLNALPEENLEAVSSNRLTKYKQILQITQHFWRRWSREYLHNLQQRSKWMFDDPQILKPGVMVLIKEDNVAPMNWKIGRILDIFPGKDNVTRVVSVKTPSGIIKRAVSKLCILPTDN